MIGLKRLSRMVFRRFSGRFFVLPGSRLDWSRVGDGRGSSTVMAPLLWIARTFPEAPPALWRQLETGQEDQIRDHPLLRLMQRPNPFYSGPILWMATMVDWNVDGNAYWLKVRNKAGGVEELWWAPHWMVEPKGDEKDYISYYEYLPGQPGSTIRLRPDDVVHFRFGLDSDDSRKGYSPLKSVLREVFTDDEAANFTAALLRNMGVPGLIVSPKDANAQPTQQQLEETKRYITETFTGDGRGGPMVMSGPTQVEQFGFSPEQLVLKDIRRIPEERVTAVLGVPAIVAGLGAGLDRSTFTNMGEAREMAYESNIIPSQRIIAEDIRFQLLPDFEPADDDLFTLRFGFDLSKVRVLQEDVYRQAQRLDLGIRGGWVRVSEGRRHIQLPVSDSDEIYLRQLNLAQVPAEGGEPVTLAPTADGNGNGVAAEPLEDTVRRVLAET